jgi:hypothetical protein
MSRSNRDLIRRYIDDLNQRRLEILDEVVGSEVVLRSLVRADPGAETVSREEYKRQIVDRVTACPDYHVTVQTMIAEGDQVVVHWTNRWTQRREVLGVPPSDRLIEEAAISIYRIADGKIVEVSGFWDRADLWQQLGLLPETSAILSGECAPPTHTPKTV